MKFIVVIFLSGFLFLHCSKNDASVNPEALSLTLLSEREIPIDEPSGLSLGISNQSLWVVSDAPESEIYAISLEGEILQKLNFVGEDLEGIVYDSLKNVLWVVEEKRREIVEVALNGSELSRHSINVDNTDNNGLEGISINSNGQIWLANEKDPGVILSLRDDFSVGSLFVLDIAKDYSGLAFDDRENRIWIVSDESQLLIHYNAETGILKQYKLPFDKAEGISVDISKNLIYIVRESSNQLYTYELLE